MKRLTLLLTMMVMVLFTAATYAQGTVAGKVIDGSYSESLIGATVVQKGTTNGTVTDIDGTFSISVPAGEQTLVISYVGYKDQEVSVTVTDGKTTNLGRVRMEASSVALEGVNIISDRAKER